MPQISKYHLRKEIMEKVQQILLESVLKLKNQNEAVQFFSDLLTPTEQVMIAKRLSIAVLLAKGYTYESIMDILKVSRSTINSISNILSRSGKGYRKVISRILREEKIKKLFSTIEEIWDIVPSAKDFSTWGKQKWQRKMEKQAPL